MTENLANKIKQQLPSGLVDFLRQAGEIADEKGQHLYLVGGVVRDLLLERANLDLDLVLEGNAITLARQLAAITEGKLTIHKHFGTATIKWDDGRADLSTARNERYSHPGALPTIRPDSIEIDLARRDFTINAMAVSLSPNDYGRLIDPYWGRDDLNQGLIRILHRRSFIDDSTRIWRGLRYEQRLNFNLEHGTLRQLKRNSPMLQTISGDRLRHELELILKEEIPEKVLLRTGELNVLPGLHPSLKADQWLTEKFVKARRITQASPSVYMALLTYRLKSRENEKFISSLNINKSLTKILRDSHFLKGKMKPLSDPALAPSHV
ncbi:MAG: CCA tRNA nucleotidyltransferase, partial [Dehalococcoidales bacterium]|nr:CCA tRNA nucleotidyltransferase [Dehalococcoidales bacterium]